MGVEPARGRTEGRVSFGRGYIRAVRRSGVRRVWRYERERRRRERLFNRPFVPWLDGEALLRALGASEEQIDWAKEQGLA